jgi:predicted nucleic acid-binding protein
MLRYLLDTNVLAEPVAREPDQRLLEQLERHPDALHLATALTERAGTFLTGDAALARCSEVTIEVVT